MKSLTVEWLSRLNPDCAEAPMGFDWKSALAKARDLFEKLNMRLTEELRLDNNVQDASYHLGIGLPTSLTFRRSVTLPEIRLSNFAGLATITCEENVKPEVLSGIRKTLSVFGYTYIPFTVFGEPFAVRDRMNGDLFNQLFDYGCRGEATAANL